jgi:hypothetical protein
MAATICAYCGLKIDRFYTPPAKCSAHGRPTFHVRNYFVGEAREQYGPDMLLCKAHAEWWNDGHAYGPEERKATRIKVRQPSTSPMPASEEGAGVNESRQTANEPSSVHCTILP